MDRTLEIRKRHLAALVDLRDAKWRQLYQGYQTSDVIPEHEALVYAIDLAKADIARLEQPVAAKPAA